MQPVTLSRNEREQIIDALTPLIAMRESKRLRQWARARAREVNGAECVNDEPRGLTLAERQLLAEFLAEHRDATDEDGRWGYLPGVRDWFNDRLCELDDEQRAEQATWRATVAANPDLAARTR